MKAFLVLNENLSVSVAWLLLASLVITSQGCKRDSEQKSESKAAVDGRGAVRLEDGESCKDFLLRAWQLLNTNRNHASSFKFHEADIDCMARYVSVQTELVDRREVPKIQELYEILLNQAKRGSLAGPRDNGGSDDNDHPAGDLRRPEIAHGFHGKIRGNAACGAALFQPRLQGGVLRAIRVECPRQPELDGQYECTGATTCKKDDATKLELWDDSLELTSGDLKGVYDLAILQIDSWVEYYHDDGACTSDILYGGRIAVKGYPLDDNSFREACIAHNQGGNRGEIWGVQTKNGGCKDHGDVDWSMTTCQAHLKADYDAELLRLGITGP